MVVIKNKPLASLCLRSDMFPHKNDKIYGIDKNVCEWEFFIDPGTELAIMNKSVCQNVSVNYSSSHFPANFDSMSAHIFLCIW